MLKRVLLICLGLVVAIFGVAIIFGGPRTPHPMGSITDPFDSVDFSDLPPLARFTARDGTKLAYRSYAPAASASGEGSVVLIHGSSATSSSMHPMAKAFSAAGFTTYALDVRGHGGSGRKGQIAYIGLLTAQQTYQQALINRVQVQANRYADTAALFQALGGGWQEAASR